MAPNNTSKMEKSGIIALYLNAKKKHHISFLNDPTKGNIMRCLYEFTNSSYCNEEKIKIILNYFPANIKTLDQAKAEWKDDDFVAIANYLKKEGTVNPNRVGTLPLTLLLLEYEIAIHQGIAGKIIKDKDAKTDAYIDLKEILYKELEIDVTNTFEFSKDFSQWLSTIISNYKAHLELIDLNLKKVHFKLKLRSKSLLTKKDIELGITLALGLYKVYKRSETFNFIRIYADVMQQLQPLHINSFFVNLSILNSFELKKKEALLKQENESFSLKIGRTDIFNLLSQDYISHKLLFNTERVIISGNPGTGKTTYTYKLCHQWVHNEFQSHKQLLHIVLKNLRFGNGNSILKYLKNNYLNTQNVDEQDLLKVLRTQHEVFVYILDGFDEMETQFKSQLFQDLNTITDRNQFILTSRPYGLLNFPLQVQHVIQIDGFNQSSISSYIDAVIATNKKHKIEDKENLKEIIKANNVLSELAHNPLMLSYMVAISLLDHHTKKKLVSVNSLYDLQLIVFKWLKTYKQSKLLRNDDSFWPDNDRLEAIAWDMQHKKTYVTSKLGYDDQRQDIFTKLSESGLGNLYEDKVEQRWSFSFNTVTFQEFFAATYYAKRLSLNSFNYLSKDIFFWNFNRLVSGFLSAYTNEESLLQLLEHISGLHKKQNKKYYLYLYYSLLSETKPEFLNNLLSASKLKTLIKDYQTASVDVNWHPILLEIIQRIIFKLTPKNKEVFLEEINTYLSNLNIDIANTQLSYTDVLFINKLAPSLKTFIEKETTLSILVDLIAHIFEELKLTTKVLHSKQVTDTTTPKRSQKYRKIKQYDLILRDLLTFVFPVLKDLLPEAPEKFNATLKRLESNLTTYCILDMAMVKSHYQTLEHSERIIDELLVRIEDSQSLSDNEMLKLLIAVTPEFYIYCALIEKNKAFSSASLKKVVHLSKWIMNSVAHQNLNEYEEEEFSNTVIFGLKKVNQPELYSSLFYIISDVEYQSAVDIEDHNALENYIISLFEKLQGTTHKEFLVQRLLFAVFERSTNGQNLLSKYREQLFIVFKNLIEKHKEWIENFEEQSHYTQAEINIMYALEGFKRAVSFDFDKRFFIDEILGDSLLMEVNYVKYSVLIHWFTSDFGFFRDKYWRVVKKLQNEIDHEEFLFPFIFHQHKTFRFPENSTYICDFLEHLTEKENLKAYAYRNEIYVILCSKLLSLILRRGEHNNRAIILLKKALRANEIRALVKDTELFDHMDVVNLVAFVKLYYLTQEDQDLTGFDYVNLFDIDVGLKRDFNDYIINFFSSIEGGFQNNVSLVRKELGEAIYTEITQQHKDFVFENFQYAPKTLSSLVGS